MPKPSPPGSDAKAFAEAVRKLNEEHARKPGNAREEELAAKLPAQARQTLARVPAAKDAPAVFDALVGGGEPLPTAEGPFYPVFRSGVCSRPSSTRVRGRAARGPLALIPWITRAMLMGVWRTTDQRHDHRADVVEARERGERMDWKDRIVLDPAILAGKPVVKGTRLAVEFIIDLLAQGWTEADLLENFPGLEHADIQACLAYASSVLKAEQVYPLPA